MFQSQIASIIPDGSFPTQYGQLFAFIVSFTDGKTGQANAKSATPPYRVGDVVGYDITGQKPNGTLKIKITTNISPTAPIQINPAAPIQPNPGPAMFVPRKPEPTPPATAGGPAAAPRDGRTVGMALKLAGDILMHNARSKAAEVDLPHLARDLKAVAECVLDASYALEHRAELSEDVPY